MLISKSNLAVLEATVKTRENIYALDNVMIKDGKMWASDGHCLYSTTLPTKDSVNYPVTDPHVVNHVEGCILIPADALRKAVGNIPNNKNHPIINNINLCIDDEYKHLITTDLTTTQVVKIKHPTTSQEFPRVEMIVKCIADAKDKREFIMSMDNLEILVKVCKKAGMNGLDGVRMTMSSAEGHSPMEIETTSGIWGAIMPMSRL